MRSKIYESEDLIRELAVGALEECRRADFRNVSWLKVYFGMAGERDTPENHGTSWEEIHRWEMAR
jgi:hypothetical protein